MVEPRSQGYNEMENAKNVCGILAKDAYQKQMLKNDAKLKESLIKNLFISNQLAIGKVIEKFKKILSIIQIENEKH